MPPQPTRKKGSRRCAVCRRFFVAVEGQAEGAQQYCTPKCRRKAGVQRVQRDYGMGGEGHGLTPAELALAVLDARCIFDFAGMTMDPWQEEELRNWYRSDHNLAIVAPRRLGKTALCAAILAHGLAFVPDYQAAIASPTEAQGKEVLRQINFYISALPKSLRPEFKAESSGKLETVSGSRILVATGNANSLRGLGLDAICLDECAFIPSDQEYWAAAYPCLIQRNGRILAISSPSEGMSIFRGIFEDIEGNGAAKGWRRRWVSRSDSGRFNEEKLEQMKSVMDPESFAREMLGKWESETQKGDMALSPFPLLDAEMDDSELLATMFSNLCLRKGFK